MDRFKYYYVFVLYLKFVWSLNNEGDPCTVNDAPGVCTDIGKCSYGFKVLTVDQRKPTMCRWNQTTRTRIVCCPLEDQSHTIGVLSRFFSATKDGIFSSKNMSCRYDGSLPMQCCSKEPEAPLEPDSDCPPLPLPEGNTTDFIFKKCLEYQRHVNKCLSKDDDPNSYHREYSCGFELLQDRIVGGIPAGSKEFPHMALLGCLNTVNTASPPVAWVAGGSLISDRFILTAAHAVNHREYGPLRYALLGATNKSLAREGDMHIIIEFFRHNSYRSEGKEYDIALLKLDRRVQFCDHIRPACLPSPAIPVTSSRIVAGWGLLGENREDSEVLMKVGTIYTK